MIEIFKNWIVSMLCIGIFTTIIQLIIPKTNLKKYIYTLIGIVTITVIISPVIDMFKSNSMEDSVSEVLAKFSNTSDKNINIDKIKDKSDNVVREQFIFMIKDDIKSKLELKGIIVNNVDIKLNDNYDIQRITINIKSTGKNSSGIDSVNSIVTYIHDEYEIEYSKITVTEEGN